MTRTETEFCPKCEAYTEHYIYNDKRYENDRRAVCSVCKRKENSKRYKKRDLDAERLCKHHGAVQWRKYGKQIRCPLCVKANNDKQTARRIATYGSS